MARVAADPALTRIPVARRGEVVGRAAAVELRAGTLLTDAQVTDAAVPGAGEQLVGVAARPGQLPARGLRPGDRVLMVPVPGDQARTGVDAGATGGQPAGESVAARVAQVGPIDADGAVTVDVVVEQELGPRVAALASTGRVALVLQPGGGR